jgi:hypothetical protein
MLQALPEVVASGEYLAGASIQLLADSNHHPPILDHRSFKVG